MPNRDTTGPMGTGMRTGRQMGPCGQNDVESKNVAYPRMGRGMGRGCGRGMNRGFCRRVEYNGMNDQDFLKQEKVILEQRLSFINSQLTSDQ